MLGRKGRYNPGFLADDERRRESRRTAEMVHSITKGDEPVPKKTPRILVASGQNDHGHSQPCSSQQAGAGSNQEAAAHTCTGFEIAHWEDKGRALQGKEKRQVSLPVEHSKGKE